MSYSKSGKIIFVVSLVLIALGLLAPRVGAQSNASAIKVTSNTASAQFAKELKFEMKAESTAGDIQRVDLIYTFGDGKATNRLPTEFTPGKSVSATATKRVQQGEFAPQMDIKYYWRITDTAGNDFKSEPQTLVFSDDRFKWQKVSNDRVTVFWYNDSDQVGQQLLEWSTQGLDRLESRFGIKMSYPVHVTVYKSKEDMSLALAPRGSTFDAGATVLGEARSAYGTLLMLNQGDARTTLWHELTHLVLHDLVKGAYESNLVAWLDEGLAMYNESDDPKDSYQRALDDAIRRNDVFTVRSMTSPNGIPSKVGIWYGQARSIVAYLMNNGDRDKLGQLLTLLEGGTRIDPALKQVYGFDQDELNNRWRQTVNLPVQAPAAPAAGATAPAAPAAPGTSPSAPAAPTARAPQAPATAPTPAPTAPAQAARPTTVPPVSAPVQPASAPSTPSRGVLMAIAALGLLAVCTTVFLAGIAVFGVVVLLRRR